MVRNCVMWLYADVLVDVTGHPKYDDDDVALADPTVIVWCDSWSAWFSPNCDGWALRDHTKGTTSKVIESGAVVSLCYAYNMGAVSSIHACFDVVELVTDPEYRWTGIHTNGAGSYD